MITKDIVLEHAKFQMENALYHANDPEYKPIFAILLIEKANEEYIHRQVLADHTVRETPSGFPDTGDMFEVGYYYNIDDAIKAVEENSCDMQEGCYHAAFVLCRFPGLYPCVTNANRMYYRWNEKTNRFVQEEEPAIFAHIAF